MKVAHVWFPTLAFAFVGQILIVAQDPPEPPPPPPAPVAMNLPLPEVQAAMEQVHQQVQHVNQQVQQQVQHVNAQVQRQLAHAQRALELAQLQTGSRNVRGEPRPVPEPPEAPEPPEPPDEPFFGRHLEHALEFIDGAEWLPRELQGPSTSEPLVIPTATTDAAALAEIREDLTIMSRILQKATGRTGDRGDTMALGIVVSSFPALRRPQAMYLADYGAVFLLNVPFPLAAPADTPAAPAETPTNTAWEEARRELYGPKRTPMAGWVQKAAGARREASFDADRVERLKREVIEALKNTANLRLVKSDEQVVVAISSTAGGRAKVTREARVLRIEGDRPDAGHAVVETKVADAPEAGGIGGSTLILRVKKADADAYAAGKLDREAFAQRVSLTAY
ncbi:MAG: hypothetical protein HS113_02620 [Verrucomicrobiales bacterium]|nr:hypothetical protein [Verrucomicrobiales bacterium]